MSKYKEDANNQREVNFIEGFAFIDDLHYHPRHTWIELRNDGTVRMGLDDFALKLLGNVTQIDLPSKGQVINQRESAWSIKCGSRDIKLRSPIAGKIRCINSKLEKKPSRLKDDPYGSWLFTLEPFVLETDLQGLLIGDDAKWWLEIEADRLRHTIERDIGVTVADGGALVDTIEKLDKNEWKDLVKDFLLT